MLSLRHEGVTIRVRRVVTGHDENGKAVFASDEEIEPVGPGATVRRIWAADEAPVYPDRGSDPPLPSQFFPPVGGFRFYYMSMPPDSAPRDAPAARISDLGPMFPGERERMEVDEPGMHTTDTIDFEVVLSGELTLELDNGVEKVLRAGDTIVQNGTRHRWHNRGTEPAVFVSAVIGALRRS